MSRYAKKAAEHESDMNKLKKEITEYELGYRKCTPEGKINTLVELKSKLVMAEIHLSNDYNAMYYREANDEIYDKLYRLQVTMQRDMTSFQNDLMTKRSLYMESYQKEFKEKYKEPLKGAAMAEKVTDEAYFLYELFQNTRLLVTLQKEKISYCKNMSNYEFQDVRNLQTKFRKLYEDDFNKLFEHTVKSVDLVGFKRAKEILEIRRLIIEQVQDEDIKRKRILKRPSELQKICNKANNARSYMLDLNEEIKYCQNSIQADQEYEQLIKEYYENGQYEEEMKKLEQEERRRYDPDWVIPDEEYKDEDGNIIKAEKDDQDEISDEATNVLTKNRKSKREKDKNIKRETTKENSKKDERQSHEEYYRDRE